MSHVSINVWENTMAAPGSYAGVRYPDPRFLHQNWLTHNEPEAEWDSGPIIRKDRSLRWLMQRAR